MNTLTGQKALVTGGTRGIGFAIAKRLLESGVDVTTTGTAHSSSVPTGAKYIAANFNTWDGITEFCSSISTEHFDIVINNAGVLIPGSLDSTSIESLEETYLINVFAPCRICRVVASQMKKMKSGRIVNISSMWGVIGRKERSVYSSSKFALDGFTASIAAELAEYNILANSVAPGFVKTDLTIRSLGEEGLDKISSAIPLKRLAEPSEIAELVFWLASPLNTYITGQNIVIDGGFTRSSIP